MIQTYSLKKAAAALFYVCRDETLNPPTTPHLGGRRLVFDSPPALGLGGGFITKRNCEES